MNNKYSKPPLGLRPLRHAMFEREKEILAAMQRYNEAEKPIPKNWEDELIWVKMYQEIPIFSNRQIEESSILEEKNTNKIAEPPCKHCYFFQLNSDTFICTNAGEMFSDFSCFHPKSKFKEKL